MAEAILAEARSWLGTPFRHRGRLKGVGVDCAGLAVGVARALGLAVVDRLDYPRRPDAATLRAGLAAQLLELDPAAAEPGDLLRLAVNGKATHLAFLSRLPDGRPGLIHAYAPCRKVVEHGWDGRWPGPLVDAWRWSPHLPPPAAAGPSSPRGRGAFLPLPLGEGRGEGV